MSDFIALISGFLSTVMIVYVLSRLAGGKFNALSATMLGLGGLVLIDIPKYLYVDSSRVGWIGDNTFQEVALLIWLSSALIFLSYKVGYSVSIGTANRSGYLVSKRMTSVAKMGIVPASLALIALRTETAYDFLLSGFIRGAAVTLVIWSLYAKDRTLAVAGICSLVLLVDESSRRAYIAIAVPLLAVIGLIYRAKVGRVQWYIKAGIIVLCSASFVGLNALRAQHNFGEGFDPDSPINNTIHYMTNLSSVDTFYNTSFIYSRFPSPWPYYFGETYFSVLVAPIPRSIWPAKPVGLGAPLGLMESIGARNFDEELWQSINMFSLSPGFVGEALANFGYVAVIVMSILLGFSAAWFDRRVGNANFDIRNVPSLMLLSSFVLIHRGDFYSAVFYQIALWIGARLLIRVLVKTHPNSQLNQGQSVQSQGA